MRKLASNLLMLTLCGCAGTSHIYGARAQRYDFTVTVSQLLDSGQITPVRNPVQVTVRGVDGAILNTSWTTPDGVVNISFESPVSPSQIEAVAYERNDRKRPFAGALVSVRNERKYCVVLPPGCLF